MKLRRQAKRIDEKCNIKNLIVIIRNYQKERDRFYKEHKCQLFYNFWTDLNKEKDIIKKLILEETLNMQNNRANSILCERNELNKDKTINGSFPDQSYYWVFDGYSDIGKSNILFGTYEVQKIIWKHQNPMSCQNKKYIHIGGWMYGLGSQLMTYGLLLSYAFRMNRIMLWNPKDIFNKMVSAKEIKHLIVYFIL